MRAPWVHTELAVPRAELVRVGDPFFDLAFSIVDLRNGDCVSGWNGRGSLAIKLFCDGVCDGLDGLGAARALGGVGLPVGILLQEGADLLQALAHGRLGKHVGDGSSAELGLLQRLVEQSLEDRILS
eukprot:5818563-Alexandrium_andersonii.AAC.1